MPLRQNSSRAASLSMSLCAVLMVATAAACSPDDTDAAVDRVTASGAAIASALPVDATAPPVPDVFTRQKLTWTGCGAPSAAQGGGDRPEDLPDGTRWQCATMNVPLDYASPGGEVVKLALIRAKAAPGAGAAGLGSLVFNFGGPGGSGVFGLPALAADEYMKLHKRYDLVSFDPRGVGNSAGVRCGSDQAMDAWLASEQSPDGPAEAQAYSAGVRDFARSCAQNSGRILQHVGTQSAARDLDILRQVLGDETLNYFGVSYGTQLGGVYAHLFPNRVGRMVFDAVVDPTEGALEGALGQAAGFHRALRNFLRDCPRRKSCFFKGADAARGEKEILSLVERIDGRPLPTEFGRRLTQNLAVGGIAAALYDQQGWPLLSAALAAAAKGDGTGLLVLSNALYGRIEGEGYDNLYAANAAINCADYQDRFTADDVQKHLSEFRSASPVFGDWMAWALLQCAEWPVAGHARTIAVQAPGAAPILVIGNTGDPATPYEGAQRMAEGLGSGVGILITVKGEGHGTYPGNRCLRTLVDRYLLNGTVPLNGTTCS